MTLNWNYLVTICCFLIILPIIKEELFVFITNRTLFVFITNRTLFVFITNRTLFVFITNRTLFVFITNRTLFVFITNRPFKNSEYLKSQCINFEVNIANKICRFTQLYRSPSQKQEESQAFKSNLDMNLDPLSTINPFHYDWRFQCEIKELILK